MTNKYYPAVFPKEKEDFLKKLFQFLIEERIITRKELFKKIKNYLKNNEKENFFPPLWTLYFVYLRYFYKQKIDQRFLNLLKTVKIRSLSGIVPLSLFTKVRGSCPFNCVYCTRQSDAPKSYFADEGAVMRAIRNKYDPFLQTKDRMVQFFLSGHPIDKIDLIIQGGTFSFYPNKYREQFVKRIFDCANSDIKKMIFFGDLEFERKSKNLEEAKKKNESAGQRIIGITVETRPDFINQEEILFLRKLGVTRVEIGVQSTDDAVLHKIKRGHSIKDVIRATKLLKDSGFKITYHIMTGLPSSSFKKDLQVLEEVFNNSYFKPDGIKFYPTEIVHQSKLFDWYKEGKYKPMQKEKLLELILKFKEKIVPPWVRIHRLVRDLTKNDVAVNIFPSNFRQTVKKELKKRKIVCPCIRCREIRNKKVVGKSKINTIQYKASSGIEYFIEAIDQEYQLLGFLRLRIPSYLLKKENFFIKSIENSIMIRELHVYGQQISIGKKGKVQHEGIGKKLIRESIALAKKHQAKSIAVISGIGVRNYYRKLGFRLVKEGEYMIKELKVK